MTQTQILITCAVVVIALVAAGLGLIVWQQRKTIEQERQAKIALAVDCDQARQRVADVQTAMHQQRMNTYTLLARIKQLEGDGEPVALTTPLPSQILATDVVAEAEAILRQVGGQS